MSHTDGPWRTVDAEWLMSQRTGMGFRYFPVRAAGQTWDIATVFADEDDAEMTANVHLIAAAPDLLAACKAIAHDIRAMQFTDGEYRLSENAARQMVQFLERVVSKATEGI